MSSIMKMPRRRKPVYNSLEAAEVAPGVEAAEVAAGLEAAEEVAAGFL
jgi:hypothetical protein